MGNVNGSLHQAAATGDYNRIKWLNGKADHNQQDDDGWTPLHYAAWHDQPECAANLLTQGASASIKDKEGRTPLHLAALKDRRVVGAILCKAGADVDARDNNDLTSLHKAAVSGHSGMVQDLIKHGAAVNAHLRDGTTACHLASWKNNGQSLEALIEAGADFEAKNEIGQTPLHEAANQGHSKIVQKLLEEGADARARDNDGNTPADLATDKGHRDIADMLSQASRNPGSFRTGAPRRTTPAPAAASSGPSPSAPPMPTAALGAAGMFSPAAIAGMKKETPKEDSYDAGSNQALGVWGSSHGEAQEERKPERPSKQHQPPWISGLQAIQQAAFNMVAGDDGNQGRKKGGSRDRTQSLSAAYADSGAPSRHAVPQQQPAGVPMPAATKTQEPQETSYMSAPPTENRRESSNQGNPFMGLLGRLGNTMQQIAKEAGGQHQRRDATADQKSFEKDWAAYGKDQEGGWAMAEGSEDPTKTRSDSSVPLDDQRNKQKIEDLEKAIEERERRLKRVGQSVAQGIREDVAKLKAELAELQGGSITAAGVSANYMGIAPSPAELEFKIISYNDIYQATDGFNQAWQEGVDGRGITFRALMSGRPVSVKVLDPAGLASPAAFERESKTLAKLRHPYLVLLLGACPQGGCLIYEFLQKRSVEEIMKGPRDGPDGPPIRLDWRHRVRIAQQMASALLFLHNTRPQPVLHRDVRLGNILLDSKMNAKLGEVGLSRLQDDPLAHINRHARDFEQAVRDALPPGTAVFQAPEVLQQARFSPATDVFGLGVAMLQLLAGREPQGLADLVAGAILQRRLAGDIVDPCAGSWPEQHATAFAKMALKCVAYKPGERPDLEEDIVPDLTELAIEADTYKGAGQSSTPRGTPSALICPLTQELFQEPVIAADGFTYSRAAIVSWMKSHNTSPMTNATMPHDGLVSNRAIRKALQDFGGGQGGGSSSPAPAKAPQNQGFSVVG
ncbi:hypothetical protein WJX84_008827 [Apatococcus fuscideae]|uniref:Uncharacterized protein n=1 Tax=Apatococcus fuscideae TaxID=2026836 RepID=A0AAW1SU87_9CHLO